MTGIEGVVVGQHLRSAVMMKPTNGLHLVALRHKASMARHLEMQVWSLSPSFAELATGPK